MNVEIPKINKERNNYPCWVSVRSTKGERLKPTILCKCGVYCGIGLHHVHADGRVTASFYHEKGQNNGCGWHVFLKLLDYNWGEYPPEK